MASKPSTRGQSPDTATESNPSSLQAELRAGRWERADDLLEALLPANRMVSLTTAAYGLAGLSPPGREGEFEERIRQAGTIEEALLTPQPPADCIFDLRDQLGLPGDDVATTSCAAAGALAIVQQLPLDVTSVGDVLEVPSPAARCMFGLAIGRTARHGLATAHTLVRQLLAGDEVDDWLRLAVVRGLGDGLLGAGLAWLSNRVQQTLSDHAAWLDAVEPVTDWAVTNPGPGNSDLICSVLSRLRSEGDARQRIVRWCQRRRTAGYEEGEFLQALAATWTALPTAARAAVLRHAAELEVPLERDGLDEACGPALVAGLDHAAAQSKPLPRRFLVRLCTHPNRNIRGLAFQLLAPERSLSVVSEHRPLEASAEVVSLPASRITRSPTDRIRVMLSSGDVEGVPGLIETLDREQAGDLIPDFVAALDVPDMAVRRAAIEALGLLGTEAEVPILLDAGRRLRGLAGMVVRAIRQIGGLEDSEEIATLFDRRLRWADDEAVDDLVALAGDRASSFLGEVLHTRFYPPVRIGAARAMSRHGMRETIFALRIRALSDPHTEVREAAMDALKSLTGSAPAPEEIAGYGPLTVSVDALDEATERAASAGIRALPGLRATLAKGTWRRRMAACKALSHIRGTEAEEALYEALRDIDEDVRLAALLALKARGWKADTAEDKTLAAMAERRVDRLLKGGGDLDIETLTEGLFLGGHLFRTEVGAALSHVARHQGWRPGAEELAAWAVTRLEPHQVIVDETGLDVLLRLIDRTWQVHPFRAVLALGLRTVSVARLAHAVEENAWRWRTREAICRALARPGCPEAPALLKTFVLDSDEDVRAAALSALVTVGTYEAAKCVSEVARSPFHDDAEAGSAALAAIGVPALEMVEALASSPWWEARRLAALTFREWRGDSDIAVDGVLALAVDPEYRVAEAALEALRRHGRRPGQEAILSIATRLQTLTVYSILQWLPVDASHRLEDEGLREAICEHLRGLSEHALAYHLGVLGALKIREAIPWLEELIGPQGSRHAGVRASANEALQVLLAPVCQCCHAKGTMACVRCQGLGEDGCESCGGRGAVRKACPEPDCSAQAPARAIGSAPCKTCRGRSFVIDPCSCGGGTVRCGLCQGTGRLSCPVCSESQEEEAS